MNRKLILSMGIASIALSPAIGTVLHQTQFGGSETPAYSTGQINGQNNWTYTPNANRLQPQYLTINDSSTIGALSINQRNLFIDANRSDPVASSRRMDQWLRWSTLPVSTNNPVTYFSMTFAVGNSGTADNSELFFSVTNDGTAGGFGGYYIAFKTSAVPSGSGINVIELGGSGGGNAQINPVPALAQQTFYTMTLAAYRNGSGLVENLAGWLNPTLVDGVPTGSPDITRTLVTPVAPQTGIQLRAQNMPAAITGITIAVPEPSTYAAVLGLLALGFAIWRRRQ